MNTKNYIKTFKEYQETTQNWIKIMQDGTNFYKMYRTFHN